jgi:hypothetical protein
MEAAVLSTERREKPRRPAVVDVFVISLSLFWSSRGVVIWPLTQAASDRR